MRRLLRARGGFWRILQYVWTAPTTCLGLLFLIPVPWLRDPRVHAKLVDGVLELHGGIVSLFLQRGALLPGGAAAMTLGHVVLGIDQFHLDRTRRHERVHVRQAECWGPLFIPAYLVATIIAWARGGDFYRDNFFERQAYDSDKLHAEEGKE